MLNSCNQVAAGGNLSAPLAAGTTQSVPVTFASRSGSKAGAPVGCPRPAQSMREDDDGNSSLRRRERGVLIDRCTLRVACWRIPGGGGSRSCARLERTLRLHGEAYTSCKEPDERLHEPWTLVRESSVSGGGLIERSFDPRLAVSGSGAVLVCRVVEGDEDGVELE